jgi:hypothetical protein
MESQLQQLNSALLSPKTSRSIEVTLNNIFPEKREETRLQKVRRIMGEDVKALSDEELNVYLTEFQFLIDSWMDEYERQVFDGKTLKEVIMEA